MTSNSKFRKLILEAKKRHDLLDESHDFEGKSHDGVMINGPKVMGSADTIMIFDPKVMQEKNRIEKNIIEQNNRIEKNRIEKKRKEDKNVTSSDPEAIRLASLLLERSRVYDPKIAIGRDKQTINNWAKDIERLIRLDKRTPQEVEDVIMWCKSNGNFWIPNILSGKKLREKFPTLFSQMQTRGGKGQRTLNRYGTEPGGLGVKDYMGGDDDEQ
ncbi:MAG: hypothetical protein M0P33_11035 [Massilibacteroides sp.]|nr:hypothetical protein [Massilibacteroides sp.]